ncbi:hypothetical protein Pcinc_002176 [Petrolisthes cinctipes]|uniref:Peptidase aspartic putative domain-containing protein n=1 Tax=Petrolisthes cinctipes TaxID=88211 RepID=A0AAE1GJC3_PETCI|nr:hypothetical protein Pcinc_002176 [Petrolisthes cinctipes]
MYKGNAKKGSKEISKEKWFTASAKYATSSSKGSGCMFCSKRNHNSEKCYKFLTLNGQQRLADDFDHSSPLDLDILIDLDYYWNLITPKDAVQVGRVVALKSVFGWIMSGNIGYVNLTDTTLTPDQQDLLNMGLNCHYMTKPKPHRKRLEMEILLGDIHQLEKNGKITTSTALQPTLLAEAAKTRGVYNSKLLNKNHFLASKQLRDSPDIIIRHGMEKLQKAQAAAQGWLTRVCTKMEGLLGKSPPATSSELVEVLEEFDKRLTRLEEVQSDIELELRPEVLDEYLDKADEARQRAKHMRLLCADKLKEMTVGDKVDSVSTIASLHARLPKLELPRFDGDLKQWQSFWEQFSSHIDDTELPTISKLTYLLSLLDGSAKDVVEGVPHTSTSYRTVIDLLKQRFGKTECIIHAHVQALLALQVPVDQGKTYITQLWRLRDEVVKHTRSLEAQGITGKQYGMEKLQKAQAAAQGWLTRVCTKMEGLLGKSPPATSSELVEVLEEFDKRLTRLEEVQSDIELELRPEVLDEYLDKADEARQRAKHMRLLCADKLKEMTVGDKVDSVSTIASLHARLPKLELPRFDGDLKQWQSFWEQFSSHIDDTELPTISKLTYLLSLLDGSAKDVVEGVPHTSTSYRTVIDLLKQRFGKTECIIHAHVQALLALQVPVDQGKTYITQLWRLRDEVVKHTRSLEAQGITGKQCEVLLTPMIVSRLPTELRLMWSRDCSGHESDLDWLLNCLQGEIEVLERSEMYKGNAKKGSKEISKEKWFTASAKYATSSSKGSGCMFCSKRNHNSEKCYKFLTLNGQQRFDKIK